MSVQPVVVQGALVLNAGQHFITHQIVQGRCIALLNQLRQRDAVSIDIGAGTVLQSQKEHVVEIIGNVFEVNIDLALVLSIKVLHLFAGELNVIGVVGPEGDGNRFFRGSDTHARESHGDQKNERYELLHY